MRVFKSQKGQGWSVGVTNDEGQTIRLREFKRAELEGKADEYYKELEAEYNPAPEAVVEETTETTKPSKTRKG